MDNVVLAIQLYTISGINLYCQRYWIHPSVLSGIFTSTESLFIYDLHLTAG